MFNISRELEAGHVVKITLTITPPAGRASTVAQVEGTVKAGGSEVGISGGAHDHNLDEFLSLFRLSPKK